MRKQLLSLSILAMLSSTVLFFSVQAVSVTLSPNLKAQVLQLLEGHHWQLDEARFNTLGDNVDLTLIEIIKEQNPLPYISLRAMRALSLYPTESVADFFEQYLKTSVTKRSERKVLAIYVQIFGSKMSERVELVCSGYLTHKDPHIRVLAAKALMSNSSTSARNLVDSYLQRESTSEWEKSQVTAFR